MSIFFFNSASLDFLFVTVKLSIEGYIHHFLFTEKSDLPEMLTFFSGKLDLLLKI